jgi:acetoacetyl-CoA synthetase
MNMSEVSQPIWLPSAQRIANARLTAYTTWLAKERGLHFDNAGATTDRSAHYLALWQWSITDLNAFWQSIWDFHGVHSHSPYSAPLTERKMPGAVWFKGATLNFVEHVFKQSNPNKPAIIYHREDGSRREWSWQTLQAQVAQVAQLLRNLGVQRGDRVVAYLPNTPETIAACLAVASVGAIWSVCAPDMGIVSVLDRFKQIEPKVLIACNGYVYSGKTIDRRTLVNDILRELPTVQHCIDLAVLTNLTDPLAPSTDRPKWHNWPNHESLPTRASMAPEIVPFEHPLWIVYSSGTTGLPKPIVHSHGGVLLEALVTHLMADLGPNDKHLWLASTGWIVWNLHMAALLVGATVVLYDGNPAGAMQGEEPKPDLLTVWRICAQEKLTSFGGGAAFHTNCMKAGIRPNEHCNLTSLQTVGSTGSPLPDDAYDWLLNHVKQDLFLSIVSGGTDFAGGFVTGNVTMPIYKGQMQCRTLGHAVFAFNEHAQAVIDEVGELVCTEPLPSMPIYFWGDPEGKRLRDSYFDHFPAPSHSPDVIPWRHGDWMRITPQGGAIIYGRSDATINRYGIRMGTAELYRVVEAFDEVLDSMVVDLEYLGRESYMPLFVVLRPGIELSTELDSAIKNAIRTKLSGRHVPNAIFAVPEVPRTITGKKMELPIKKLLLGAELAKVANPGAMANPQSLEWFEAFSKRTTV